MTKTDVWLRVVLQNVQKAACFLILDFYGSSETFGSIYGCTDVSKNQNKLAFLSSSLMNE